MKFAFISHANIPTLPVTQPSPFVSLGFVESSVTQNALHSCCAVATKTFLKTDKVAPLTSLDTRYYWCNFCHFSGDSKEAIIDHVIKQHRFRCKWCDFQSFCRSSVLNHCWQGHHDDMQETIAMTSLCAFVDDAISATVQNEKDKPTELKRLPSVSSDVHDTTLHRVIMHKQKNVVVMRGEKNLDPEPERHFTTGSVKECMKVQSFTAAKNVLVESVSESNCMQQDERAELPPVEPPESDTISLVSDQTVEVGKSPCKNQIQDQGNIELCDSCHEKKIDWYVQKCLDVNKKQSNSETSYPVKLLKVVTANESSCKDSTCNRYTSSTELKDYANIVCVNPSSISCMKTWSTKSLDEGQEGLSNECSPNVVHTSEYCNASSHMSHRSNATSASKEHDHVKVNKQFEEDQNQKPNIVQVTMAKPTRKGPKDENHYLKAKETIQSSSVKPFITVQSPRQLISSACSVNQDDKKVPFYDVTTKIEPVPKVSYKQDIQRPRIRVVTTDVGKVRSPVKIVVNSDKTGNTFKTMSNGPDKDTLISSTAPVINIDQANRTRKQLGHVSLPALCSEKVFSRDSVSVVHTPVKDYPDIRVVDIRSKKANKTIIRPLTSSDQRNEKSQEQANPAIIDFPHAIQQNQLDGEKFKTSNKKQTIIFQRNDKGGFDLCPLLHTFEITKPNSKDDHNDGLDSTKSQGNLNVYPPQTSKACGLKTEDDHDIGHAPTEGITRLLKSETVGTIDSAGKDNTSRSLVDLGTTDAGLSKDQINMDICADAHDKNQIQFRESKHIRNLKDVINRLHKRCCDRVSSSLKAGYSPVPKKKRI